MLFLLMNLRRLAIKREQKRMVGTLETGKQELLFFN
jgi:hypothetical protein